MSIDEFLSRLSGVRQVGPDRWVSQCPSHEDRSPSLSIRVVDDGRILVHDFAGCDVNDVCGSIGLRVADLMPPRLDRPYQRPEERGTNTTRATAGDILELLDLEASVVLIVAESMLRHETVTPGDMARLRAAVNVISSARARIRPARRKVA